MTGQMICGDCLEVLPTLPAASVDMVLADLPYGTTACTWDSRMPLDVLWRELSRVKKRNAAVVLTAVQPFTSVLVTSNIRAFRYAWVWDKVNKYTGALNSSHMPMRRHEDVLVFYDAKPPFNKQMREGAPYTSLHTRGHGEFTHHNNMDSRLTINVGGRNPCTILQIPADIKTELGLHPTQKVVALFEYLIRTYTNEGQVVLDVTAGSGTTAVAALRAGRGYVCVERDPGYHAAAVARVAAELERLRAVGC